MNEARFPARRPDGSVSVAARFSAADRSILPRLEAFVTGWLRGISRYVDLSQDLSSLPHIAEGDRYVHIIFDGKAQSTRWKDWMVFLTRDVSESLPDIGFMYFYDLVADLPHPAPPDNESPA